MLLKNSPSWRWLAVGLMLLPLLQTQAQTRAAAGAAAAVTQAPPTSCVIAEFRFIALNHHDPKERQDKAIAWLQKNGPSCSAMQMSILISSRASLMGTSDTLALSTVFDALMEKRLENNPAALDRYYRPVVQGPGRGKEDAPPPATTEAGASKAGAGAPGTPGAGGAPLPGVAVVAAGPGMVAGAPASAQNISINMPGAPIPVEDMSRKFPLPSEPLFQFPPEYGASMLNYFGKIRRQFTRTFFMETLTPGKCPEGMTWRNDNCEATIKVAWKFGEKVPQGTKTYPVDAKLIEKLNFDPGYMFIRIGGDILALEKDTGKIADAVLNLGKPT